MNTIHIYFQDEARRIGSGWRTCEVNIKGSKVSLRECATGSRVRMSLAIFKTLKHIEVKVRKRFLPKRRRVSKSAPAWSPGP